MAKRALLSVSDKTGIIELAEGLAQHGIEIVSTGGTANILRKEGIEVTDVSDITGFPEMMDGRVKTLHPKIHGGLLCLRNNAVHMEEAVREDISMIDIVTVNLYPFEETISKKDISINDAIENIDIGGPTLIRAAAKNYQSVTVICDPGDYTTVLESLENDGAVPDDIRKMLAVKAFRHTADYDSAIDTYLSKKLLGEDILRMKFNSATELRYGENWHQEAKIYIEPHLEGPSVAKARQLHGKKLSYNNYIDADNALQTVKEIEPSRPAVAIVKHNNPCGFATGDSLAEALQAAWNGDPVSGFGSIICTNQTFDLESAKILKGRFIELILAPDFEPDALEYLKEKSEKLRILELPELNDEFQQNHTYRYITGGLLKQSRNIGIYEKWECVTDKSFPEDKRDLAEFSLHACKCIKSNAVSIAYEYKKGCFMLLAMGAGQPNRVDSIRKLAATKAIENLELIYQRSKPDVSFEKYCQQILSNCVMASDAFFPFDDSIVQAAENNIYYIVSPGGSIRDDEVIATANRLGVSLVFTGMRHFLH
ncbi:phosphoribosylaminoimidazolecarboxamide formyltransferase/IMP cyclohydrolase [Methanosalsum zhilinae DSM 4017]|uniref:Phosphoribosylaminoimidazolecarboxamide formyltransferase/IMP cyclohydrolase n=1 Tax=Methanosalsum zhilinae (strain DSM 4017 / NBRC 107636 / OCM 62 / WeN5) TaxID=679901 RepID=F7XKE3_METZD|nr:bifunctional phosphoribosylaminoimidazolecarboxamide formyltransferase/IMP cyclohydrolase [Methanosalsum zhilinae]AEH61711.1 phosphoribosylaminoimidazolecarboxamide formyltransferase/IMP cyclohydrolase [Methanosalsum zhilinae DSM 4017]